MGKNHGADLIRPKRVADSDRNRTIDRRLDRFGMQDLCTKVSKFCRFFIAQNGNRPRVAADARVASHHARYIGPNLQLVCF